MVPAHGIRLILKMGVCYACCEPDGKHLDICPVASRWCLDALQKVGYPIIASVAESQCPTCGASASILEIRYWNYSPLVGLCNYAGHVWEVMKGTHAGKAWEEKNKWYAMEDLKNGQ